MQSLIQDQSPPTRKKKIIKISGSVDPPKDDLSHLGIETKNVDVPYVGGSYGNFTVELQLYQDADIGKMEVSIKGNKMFVITHKSSQNSIRGINTSIGSVISLKAPKKKRTAS